MNNTRLITSTHQKIPLLLPDRAQRRSQLKSNNNNKKKFMSIKMSNTMKMKLKKPRVRKLIKKVSTKRVKTNTMVIDQEEKETSKEEEEVAEAATEVEEATEAEVATNKEKMSMKMDSK